MHVLDAGTAQCVSSGDTGTGLFRQGSVCGCDRDARPYCSESRVCTALWLHGNLLCRSGGVDDGSHVSAPDVSVSAEKVGAGNGERMCLTAETVVFAYNSSSDRVRSDRKCSGSKIGDRYICHDSLRMDDV